MTGQHTYNVTVTATVGDQVKTVTIEGIRADDEWKARTRCMAIALNDGAFDDMTGFTTDYDVTEVD